MSKAKSNTATNDSPPRHRIWIVSGILAAFCAIGLLTVWLEREPTFGGKSVSQWFEKSEPMTSDEYQNSECRTAFAEMEGDAVPFLNGWLDLRPSSFDGIYAFCFQHMSSSVKKALPKPRDDSYYRVRKHHALRLLGDIGMTQRFRLEAGKPSAKPSIALAVPRIKIAMQGSDADARLWAANAAWFIGPVAAATIPDLIKLAQNPQERAASAAVQGLGMMGSLASNAVPMLIAVATNTDRRDRILAISALGNIGGSAHLATRILTLMLNDTNDSVRLQATRSLAAIGTTPDEAISSLNTLTHGTNDWERCFAWIALWNKDRQDSKLQAHVIEGLQSTNRIGVLVILRLLGTNAAVFVPEVRHLTEDSFAADVARRTLREIQLSQP